MASSRFFFNQGLIDPIGYSFEPNEILTFHLIVDLNPMNPRSGLLNI
jgi:hypothetical protein